MLGPEADVLASVDSAGLGQATLAVLRRAAQQPGAVAAATLRFWSSAALAGPGGHGPLAGHGGGAAGRRARG